MTKLPSMPLFVADYLADTRHLTLAEHGAYCLLLMNMWAAGGELPDNDANNARMLGVSPKNWISLKARLLPFFEVYGPSNAQHLTQKKLQRLWNYQQGVHAVRSEQGRRGAKSKHEKDRLLRGLANGSAMAQPQAKAGDLPWQNPGILERKKEREEDGSELAEPKEVLKNPLLESLERMEKRTPFLPRSRRLG